MGMKTKDMAFIGLMTAVICIFAPITVYLPFSPVPITLAMAAILLAGAVLGSKKGTICVLLYLLLGCIGLPVFSGFTGGIQKLLGPTGGYLIGDIFMVFATGYIIELNPKKIHLYPIGMAVGAFLCYLFGAGWLSWQSNLSLVPTLVGGILPFIPLDIIKVAAVTALSYQIRNRVSTSLEGQI